MTTPKSCCKCRCVPVGWGADGKPYCAYCIQYAPKPVRKVEESGA